jgi:hypothetical protein
MAIMDAGFAKLCQVPLGKYAVAIPLFIQI